MQDSSSTPSKGRKKERQKNFKPLHILIIILIISFMTHFAPQPLPSASSGSLAKGGGKRENILVMGTDGGGTRADVIMILSVSGGEINLISVPRDTRIETSSGYVKINSALALGGDDYLIEKVQQVTGIEIHEYMKVDFDAVENMIDAFGGVDFEVPQDMDYEDPEQDLYIHIKQGYRHLNGEESLKLLRFRGYAMADIQRTAVQRDFIKAFINQHMNLSLAFKLPRVAFEYARGTSTSLNIFETAFNGVKLLAAGRRNFNTIEIPYYFSPSGTYVLIDGEKMAETVTRYFE